MTGHSYEPSDTLRLGPPASMREHPAEPRIGSITDRYGIPCTGTSRSRPGGPADLTDEQAADRYPLHGKCKTCGQPVAAADGTADWDHDPGVGAYAAAIRRLDARPGLMITYQGTDRKGNARGGATRTETPAVLGRRLYNAGWREARLRRNGILVGAIERHPGTGRRTWWAES